MYLHPEAHPQESTPVEVAGIVAEQTGLPRSHVVAALLAGDVTIHHVERGPRLERLEVTLLEGPLAADVTIPAGELDFAVVSLPDTDRGTLQRSLTTPDSILGAFVYCAQHLRPHTTGWCGVSVRDKVPLDAGTLEEAYEAARQQGLRIA